MEGGKINPSKPSQHGSDLPDATADFNPGELTYETIENLHHQLQREIDHRAAKELPYDPHLGAAFLTVAETRADLRERIADYHGYLAPDAVLQKLRDHYPTEEMKKEKVLGNLNADPFLSAASNILDVNNLAEYNQKNFSAHEAAVDWLEDYRMQTTIDESLEKAGAHELPLDMTFGEGQKDKTLQEMQESRALADLAEEKRARDRAEKLWMAETGRLKAPDGTFLKSTEIDLKPKELERARKREEAQARKIEAWQKEVEKRKWEPIEEKKKLEEREREKREYLEKFEKEVVEREKEQKDRRKREAEKHRLHKPGSYVHPK